MSNSSKTPNGKLVEIDGITYQIIDGKLYRYVDLTFDKGFKIVLGRIGSEEVLRHLDVLHQEHAFAACMSGKGYGHGD